MAAISGLRMLRRPLCGQLSRAARNRCLGLPTTPVRSCAIAPGLNRENHGPLTDGPLTSPLPRHDARALRGTCRRSAPPPVCRHPACPCLLPGRLSHLVALRGQSADAVEPAARTDPAGLAGRRSHQGLSTTARSRPGASMARYPPGPRSELRTAVGRPTSVENVLTPPWWQKRPPRVLGDPPWAS